jgi:hypothetical protein
MNYGKNRQLMKHAAQLGYKTVAQFAHFLKQHQRLLHGGH